MNRKEPTRSEKNQNDLKRSEKNRKEPKRTKKIQKDPKSDDHPNQVAHLDNIETVLRLSKLAS